MGKYEKVISVLKEYYGTAVNTLVVAATIAFEALLSWVTYACPCIESDELPTCVANSNTSKVKCETLSLSYYYGVSYLAAPAFCLFILGMAVDTKLWKIWTGYFRGQTNTQVEKMQPMGTRIFVNAVLNSLISPIAWVCFGLLDGRYYACATTPLPYNLGKTEGIKTCIDISAKGYANVDYGQDFSHNRSISQIAGWCTIAAVGLVSFLLFARSKCKSPLTYYHHRYFKYYTQSEEEQVVIKMGEEAKELVSDNITSFLAQRRKISDWDDISGVYKFEKDKEGYGYYSGLHKWIRTHEKKEENATDDKTIEKGMFDDIMAFVDDSIYLKIKKALEENKLALANSAIIGVTAIFEVIADFGTFKCPCVDVEDFLPCNITTEECDQTAINYFYGVAYLAAPAFALFLIGISISPKLWKYWTSKHKKGRGFFLGVLARSLISPIAWLAFGLLGGKYYACAVTHLPYDFNQESKIKTCSDVASTPSTKYSEAFNDNVCWSQVIGWCVIAGVSLIAFIMHCWDKCHSPMTYFQEKYFKIYREIEEKEFDKQLKQTASNNALKFITEFLKEKRKKSEWDEISTAYSFGLDTKKLPIYSYLHQWYLRNQKNVELKEVKDKPTDNGNKVVEVHTVTETGALLEDVHCT